MPYFTQDYCDGLVGKTVERVVGDLSHNHHRVTIFWTDGTHTKIDACVEHEKVSRWVSLICNTYE